MRASDFLFEVKFRLYRAERSFVTIRAFDTYRTNPQTGHSYLRCELVFNGKKIFNDGRVGIPSHKSIDGADAKEGVVSLFCLKPGDTDQDFFEDYTEEQLQFVTEHGEALYCAKCDRWGWDS